MKTYRSLNLMQDVALIKSSFWYLQVAYSRNTVSVGNCMENGRSSSVLRQEWRMHYDQSSWKFINKRVGNHVSERTHYSQICLPHLIDEDLPLFFSLYFVFAVSNRCTPLESTLLAFNLHFVKCFLLIKWTLGYHLQLWVYSGKGSQGRKTYFAWSEKDNSLRWTETEVFSKTSPEHTIIYNILNVFCYRMHKNGVKCCILIWYM